MKTVLFRQIRILCVISMLLLLCGCAETEPEVLSDTEISIPDYTLSRTENSMDCVMFRVGAADAMLLATEHHTILLDTGEKNDDDAAKITGYLESQEITHLDAIILSNMLPDNIGGLGEILQTVTTDAIYVPSYNTAGHRGTKFLRTAAQSGAELFRAENPVTLTYDDVTITLTPASQPLQYAAEEDLSFVTTVTHGKNTLLLTSDIKEDRIADVMKTFTEPFSIVKMPGHGQWFPQSEAFLDQYLPKYTLISDSAAHEASYDMLSLLAEKNILCYRTKDAHVCFYSNGKRVRFSQQ